MPLTCEELHNEVLLSDCILGQFGGFPMRSTKACTSRVLAEKPLAKDEITRKRFATSLPRGFSVRPKALLDGDK